MRLEQLPLLKIKIEELLNNLIDSSVEQINWTINTDIGERILSVKIEPVFKNMVNPTKFGVIGEKGSDTVGKPRDEDMKYPNPS
jgi:hypothetical protein